MPHTPTLENPFAPEKHRSADDPKFVGKILGADAEAAMRRSTPSPARRGEGEVGDNLVLTPEEQERIAEEKEKREAPERVRRSLLAWAKEIGKDEKWILETFTIHFDGTLTVAGDLDLQNVQINHLPDGLREVKGNLNLSRSDINSFDGFPQIIGGHLSLMDTHFDSLDGLTRSENIKGGIYLLTKQHDLGKEMEKKGYIVWFYTS